MTEINNILADETTIEQELDAAYHTTGQAITILDALNQALEQRLAGGTVE